MTRTHLDLFSGIGGFALACRWCGVETVGFCELEPYAQQVIIKNFGAVMADAEHAKRRSEHSAKSRSEGRHDSNSLHGREEIPSGPCPCSAPRIHPDIFTINGAEYRGVWLLTGGFPCQPFSCAGKRRGKEDDRHLWPEMRRVIAEARPRWVIGENVAGIINMELDSVLSDLEGIGYTAWPVVIPAVAVDARHRRDRVWIVAHNASAGQGDSGEVQTRSEQSGRNSVSSCSLDVPNSPEPRSFSAALTGIHSTEEISGAWNDELERPCFWSPEPDVGRVAHGIPRRVDRLKGLGNAIVPQVAARIIQGMIEEEKNFTFPVDNHASLVPS